MHTNSHIEKYLDFYINDIKNPEFAILLTGEWGSGILDFLQ
jgi:hypothetical protein